MRRDPILVILMLLAACSQESERMYTVDEFIGDEALIRTISECRNNPGELREMPNCRNAEAADGKLRLQKMRKAVGG